ncbi:MAG: hypothetical protein KAY37_02015 [Phycisphaerae bacterium]|nr:hypothetical protein [Phycisphaerae bacterium]
MFRWTTLATLLCVAAARAADPPPPNPDQPVDYVTWINEGFARQITDNAADTYRQAFAAFMPDANLMDFAKQADADQWPKSQRKRLQRWIRDNEKCLEHFAVAAGKRRCFFELRPGSSGALYEAVVPEISAMRSVEQVAAARARLRLLEGDVDGATDDVIAIFRASRHMQSQPFLWAYLGGLAMNSVGHGVLLDVPRLAPEPVNYDRILKKLKDADREPRRPSRQIMLEKLMVWDIAQRYARDTDGDGRYDTLALPRELSDIWGLPSGNFTLNPPKEFDTLVSETSEYFDPWRKVFTEDYQAARRHGSALEQRVKDNTESVLGAVGPAFSRVVVVRHRALASRHARQLVLYLHAYHAKNGRWPEELKQALPRKAAGLTVDPFSNKPFGYRLKNGEPMLYSVSENGVDDGGTVFRKDGKARWGDTGDFVFWPPQE